MSYFVVIIISHLIVAVAGFFLGWILAALYEQKKYESYCVKCRAHLGLKISMIESSGDFRICPRCGYMDWY